MEVDGAHGALASAVGVELGEGVAGQQSAACMEAGMAVPAEAQRSSGDGLEAIETRCCR